MNSEIEKKYKINTYEKAKEEIIALGASHLSTTTDVDVYFLVPQAIPNTRYLRVRTKGGKNTLAYHEVVDDLETKEWEVDVSDADVTHDIVEKLGFAEEVVVKKTRETYTLGDSEILVDCIDGLGHFVEIESPDVVSLDKIAGKITLGDQIVGKGYPDLVKEKSAHETAVK